MSVSLLEALEGSGYNFYLREDCEWLVSKQSEFEELIEKAQETIEGYELTEEIESGDEQSP